MWQELWSKGEPETVCGKLQTERQKRLPTLPQGWPVKIIKLLIAGLSILNSDTVLCIQLNQESTKMRTIQQWGHEETNL